MSVWVTAVSFAEFAHGFEYPNHGDICSDRSNLMQVYDITPEIRDGLKEGCYSHTGAFFRFRAGNSYTGYNDWIDFLCRATLKTHYRENRKQLISFPNGPFYELFIGESDTTIGPVSSQNLLADFRLHADNLVQLLAPMETEMLEKGWSIEWWIRRYKYWQTALELASKQGLVAIG